MTGPFGATVTTLTIPAHLLGSDIDTAGLEAREIEPIAGGFRFRVETAQFAYGAYGLERRGEDASI